MAGVPGARSESVKMVEEFLSERGVEVEGMDLSRAAYEIYRELWGLGPLEEVYRDPAVNEIQVNALDKIFVLRNLRLEPVEDVRFRDDDHVMSLVTRMVMHDRGVSLNRSSPTIESMRKDGTRITATCPPVSEYVTLTLRKHIPRAITFDEMVERGTMDEKGRDLLKLLVRGRANIAVVGGVGSGKTTMVRTLFSETDPRARTVVLETDRELFLSKNYPGHNIVELEEHPEVGRTLKGLFRVVLRFTPTMIIVGEFRGEGEATEAVRACERGHDGSITTAHFGSAPEFVSGTARLLVKEGLNLPREAAEELVAAAFNVVVKMFGDSTRGVIKLESVTELVPGNPVQYRDLLRWVPSGDDYLKGDWKLVERPGKRLLSRLFRYGVTGRMVEEVYEKWS
ncbi:pilus assembly protein CpaF [Desulfofundulus australicus DSM 11792]|uniref:Pilus assembly protein CpaF n=2 Tax=Desulfofundulus australicus TaxID=1566 RepID=A0A1M4XW92_9FIRM|nr:pilus assembly protein CpaF [Desulfofundulus australicus DSM 11792]